MQNKKERVYTEVGLGNQSFFSTEFEKGDIEHRIPKFILPNNIEEIYFRLWIFKKVFILSSKYFFKVKTKNKNKLKILFGIGGYK